MGLQILIQEFVHASILFYFMIIGMVVSVKTHYHSLVKLYFHVSATLNHTIVMDNVQNAG